MMNVILNTKYYISISTSIYLLHKFQRGDQTAQVGIFSVQRFPLVALTLLDEPLGDDAELLAVDQSLPVGVGRGRHEQGVYLKYQQK